MASPRKKEAMQFLANFLRDRPTSSYRDAFSAMEQAGLRLSPVMWRWARQDNERKVALNGQMVDAVAEGHELAEPHLSEVHEIVTDLDPSLETDDQAFVVAVLLLSALNVGAEQDRLSAFTGYPPEVVAPIEDSLRSSGIWVGETTRSDWIGDDGTIDGMCFWIDVAVGCGYLARTLVSADRS